jgi:hypothetical protein
VAEQTVFISHSSNGDPQDLAADDPHRARLKRAQEVRAAICDGLPEGLTAWVDSERINAGSLWRLEIFENLYACAAGILLLDEDSLARDWVHHEATILNYRRRINPRFLLIPVILDGGSSQALDQGRWKPLALRDLQVHKGSPDAIVDAVVERLAPLEMIEADKDVRRWTEDVATALRKALDDQPDRLTDSCGLLGIEPVEWISGDVRSLHQLAHALISADPEVILQVLGDELIRALPEQETRRNLSRLVRPLWVNLGGAASTAAALRAPPPSRRLALNTDSESTARDYVERAVACNEKTTVLPCTSVTGEDVVEELVQLAEQEVFNAFPLLTEGEDTEGLEGWLAKRGRSLVLVVPGAQLTVAQLTTVLDKLATRFPGVTTFVLSGGAIDPSDLDAVPGLAVVVPSITRGEELDARGYREEINQFSASRGN